MTRERRWGGKVMIWVAIATAAATGQAQLTWDQLNVNGFGDADNENVFDLHVHGGVLYAGTSNGVDACEVWRFDGPTASDWTRVGQGGFGDTNNSFVGAMASYDGNLYAATSNPVTGTEVWRYDGPGWTQVNTDGFGAGSEFPFDLHVFDGKLWLGSYPGGQVFAYDGATWTQMNVDGFGNGSNTRVRSLTTYQGSLYAGVLNTVTGGEVWRYDGPTASDWTAVSTGGFGDPNNVDVRSLAVHGGTLVGGTVNVATGAEAWAYDGANWTRVDPGTIVAEVFRDMLVLTAPERLVVSTADASGSTQVWQYDGSEWTQLNTDGFGDVANSAGHTVTLYDRSLWVGTNHYLGGEVWRSETVSDVLLADGFEDGGTSAWSAVVP